ncbi:MAG: hypothetical protein KAU20_00395 [Nanoarchaeota archaeon]|nr:hypothetical protein [Nanoarchaeota archaeon]
MKPDKTQSEFDSYLTEVPDKEKCKYMEDIYGITNLCNNMFKCRYQSKVSFRFRTRAKHECQRPHHMKLKKLL